QQRPRVEEARLVRVVLERHEVVAEVLGEAREPDRRLRVLRRGRDERAEPERVAVVGHARTSPSAVVPSGPADAGAGTPRAAATSSRAAGATSWPTTASVVGSSPMTTYVDTPCSSVTSAICSAHWRGEPRRNPPPPSALKPPPTLSRRRTARGSRPASSAAASIVALPRARASKLWRYGRDGSQPSAFAPTRRSMRG